MASRRLSVKEHVGQACADATTSFAHGPLQDGVAAPQQSDDGIHFTSLPCEG